ncbi:MAG: EamA family transporter [Candidatus Nealsonbacteria bacterium]
MWFILGILSGLFFALQSMISKKALEGVNHYLVAFAYAAFSLPYFLVALFWMDLSPLNPNFWWAAAATSTLNVIAIVLLMKALRIGELSLTMPFLSFTPIFLILTSNLMLKESPGLMGIAGIILIVAGAYALEVKRSGGIAGPFRAFLKNRGGQLVLLVAFIYAISSNLDKITVQNSDPFTRNIVVLALMTLMLFLLIQFKSEQKLTAIKPKLGILLIAGLFAALTLLAQMTALTLNIVPYIISLKRTSALFCVILGFIAFKERNIKPKLLGSILMVIGVILISLS